MPSPPIDVVIWDNDADDEVVAVPVSDRGLAFIRGLTNEKTMAMTLGCGPEEFLAHVPPDVTVVFRVASGQLMQVTDQKSLQ